MPRFVQVKPTTFGQRSVRCRCVKPWKGEFYEMSPGAVGDIVDHIALAAVEAGYLVADPEVYRDKNPFEKMETREKPARRPRRKATKETTEE